MGNRQYDDDDGRTVADMSRVEEHSIVSMPSHDRTQQFDREERRAVIRGALGASLLIGVVYLAVFAIVIVLLLFLWGAL